jgi:hypothetical protein
MNAPIFLLRTGRVIATLLASTAVASAATLQGSTQATFIGQPPTTFGAPEISPALLASAIVLAVGGMLILTDWLRRRAHT